MIEVTPSVRLYNEEQFSRTGEVVALLPGALYDSNQPPESSILNNIKNNLSQRYSFIELSNISAEGGEYIRDISPSLRAEIMGDALETLGSTVRNVEKITVVSHSVGSFTATSLMKRAHGQPELPAVSGAVFLSPPPLYTPEKTRSTVRGAIEMLLGSISTVEYLGTSHETHKSSSGRPMLLDKDFWDDIERLTPECSSILSSSSIKIACLVGMKDRVFKPIDVLETFTGHHCTTLADTHSLKQPTSVNIATEALEEIIGEVHV
ncbi:hypothetical protein KDA11_06950 [Candidatus Saccharibacteria bacterium]|nr:hypothetical protein [Candidatus Saccharibacteria bacterium]